LIPRETYRLTQKVFRILLDAYSHPGRIYSLFNGQLEETQRSSPILMVLMTLLNHEVTFHVLGEEGGGLEKEIIERTGSRVATPNEADFILSLLGNGQGTKLQPKRGTQEYPDTSATLIFLVKRLSQEPPGNLFLSLKGPGIKNEARVCMDGFGKREILHLKEINSEYPLGVESIFVDPLGRLMCIPRSTQIELRETWDTLQ